MLPQAFLNKLRQNKFLLILNLPKILKNVNSNSARSNDLLNFDSLQYSVYGTAVPKITIPNITLPFMGQNLNVTSQARQAYNPVNVNFTIDNRMNNYWVLWKWLDIMNNARESGMSSYFNQFVKIGNEVKMTNGYFDYQTIITALIKDEYNVDVAKVIYTNAFITDLGEIRYSYREVHELESSFTFAFSQMNIELV
jgi:hypothetical protein